MLARRGDFGIAQCGTVHIVRTSLVRRANADDGLAADQRRFVGDGLGRIDGGIDRFAVVALHVGDDVPAVGLKTFGRIVGKPAAHMTVDGDVVIVPEGDQFAQAPGSGQRAGFVRNTFHHATVTHKYIGVMVDDFVPGFVEFVGQQLFGHRHAYGVGDALAQRTAGSLYPCGITVLGVARGLGVHLTETLQFVHGQVIARQVQQRVDQHRSVAVGHHEAVAVRPFRIGRIVAQVMVPQNVGDFRHAHRGAGVTGVGLLNRVHRQHANRAGDVIEFWGGYITCRSHFLPPKKLP